VLHIAGINISLLNPTECFWEDFDAFPEASCFQLINYRPALVIVFVDVCIPIDGHFYAAHFSVAIKGLSFGSFLSKEPATSMLILRRNASLVLLPELETTRMA
jgi:hypothetical protein